MTNVFFVRGLPDNNEVTAGVSQGKIVFHGFGGANVMKANKYFEQPIRPFEAVFFGEGIEAVPQCSVQPDLIFNEISDPDSHGIALSRAATFCDQFPSVPVINHPIAVEGSTRDRLASHFHSPGATQVDGLRVPKTIRCQLTAPEQVMEIAAREGLTMPVLVRVAGQHGGKTLVRVDSADDFAALNPLPLDGRDFYLTEYVDFCSPDGFYRKLRIAVVDGELFFRHYLVYDDWQIHFAQREFMLDKPDLLKEEEEMMESFEDTLAPKLRPAIDALRAAINLQYFGIDANINDAGEVLLFEANANMNILAPSPQSRPLGTKVVKRIATRLKR